MRKIGISTSCLYPLETENSLKFLGASGVKRAEIFFNAACELKDDFVELLRKIKDEYGMKIVSVHPTMSLAESFMLFSAYERRYYEGLEQYKRYGEIAAELGAEYIIMHGGKPNGVLDDLSYCERFVSIARAVKENGAQLLQENVVNFRAGSLDMLRTMKEQLGGEVGFCIDVKQSIRAGYSPIDAINTVGENLKHLHISDNTPDNDCMLPTRGSFNFTELFCAAENNGFKGDAIIEVYRNAYGEYSEIIDSYKKIKAILE